jgi:hypothetical protein
MKALGIVAQKSRVGRSQKRGARVESRRGQGRPSLCFRVDEYLACACFSCTPHDLVSHSLRPTYRVITSGMRSTWHLADSLVDCSVLLRPPPARRGCRVMCRGHLDSEDLFALSKKALLVSLAGSNTLSSHSGAALQRGAVRRSTRTFVRQYHTLVARSVKHSGSSLPGRAVRAARVCHVIIISATQRRPRSYNKTHRIRSV